MTNTVASTRTRHWTLVTLLTLALLAIGCASTRPAGEQMSDAAITSKIKAKLAADPQVNPFNIDVDTIDGAVVLRGEVQKEVAREEAESLALATAGVVSVANRIEVVPAAEEDNNTLADSVITSKIKAKLAADPQVNPFNIDVDTLDGRVTLSGRVKTAVAASEAEQLAAATEGVVEVDNQLEVLEQSESS